MAVISNGNSEGMRCFLTMGFTIILLLLNCFQRGSLTVSQKSGHLLKLKWRIFPLKDCKVLIQDLSNLTCRAEIVIKCAVDSFPLGPSVTDSPYRQGSCLCFTMFSPDPYIFIILQHFMVPGHEKHWK